MSAVAASRLKIVCPACTAALIHRLVTLHAEEDTLIVCSGAWDSVPQWARDAFTNSKGKGIAKRREAVREIQEQLKA